MKNPLRVNIGQFSNKGSKALNQDALGASIPQGPLLSTKGIALAIADGISSSNVSQVASEAAVTGFLQDYLCTSEAWSVKTSVERVLSATNAWMYAQTRNGPYRYYKEKGYICTFCAMVLKANKAHIFHVGDTRVYRYIDAQLEQLTEDHRHYVDRETHYLTRALGMHSHLTLDHRLLTLEEGDMFLLATDGVAEFISADTVYQALTTHPEDFNRAARAIGQAALAAGSDDNLSVQLLRVDALPDGAVSEIAEQAQQLPLPPPLQPRMIFEGYTVERQIYISSRSHVFLARDQGTGEAVVLKTPSTEMRGNSLYLERFLMEDWIARRLDNLHVLRAHQPGRKRNYLYLATEYVAGQTLAQWMHDHPQPTVEEVRAIIEQVAKGLQAFHRHEMIHQDLRPANVLIDNSGTVKIIDFGSTKVAGVAEIQHTDDIQGTAQYTAPEYFLSEQGSARSDIFSLGVICYHMLSGDLPYGTAVASARSPAAQRRLKYLPLSHKRRDIPAWIDLAIKKAVSIQPHRRYAVLSEFMHDLRNPNRAFIHQAQPPLIERNPVAFWQGVSALLLCIVIGLLAKTV